MIVKMRDLSTCMTVYEYEFMKSCQHHGELGGLLSEHDVKIIDRMLDNIEARMQPTEIGIHPLIVEDAKRTVRKYFKSFAIPKENGQRTKRLKRRINEFIDMINNLDYEAMDDYIDRKKDKVK